MTREPLPDRRYGESIEVRHAGFRYAMQIGCYDDGRVGEIFLGQEKAAGSLMDVMARDTAVLISMNLQHGCPPDRMLRAITKDENGQPEGIAGAVLQQLVSWQPKTDGWAPVKVWADAKVEAPAPVAIPASPTSPKLDRVSARQLGFTGDQCSGCQSFTMVRNGTCLKCETCGATTGCS